MKVLPKGQIRYRLNPRTQLIEGIDTLSGQIVCVQKTFEDKLAEKESELVEVKTRSGKTVMVEKGVDLSRLKGIRLSTHVFSDVWADLICAKIEEGAPVSKISRTSDTKNWPNPTTIARWRREHPEFDAQVKAARLAKGEYFADKVIETAGKTREWNAKSSRVKVDAYKWGAAVNDPETFGNRTKVVGDPDRPLMFMIDTGVRREPIVIPQGEPIDVTGQHTSAESAAHVTREDAPGDAGREPVDSNGAGYSLEGDGERLVSDGASLLAEVSQGFEDWDQPQGTADVRDVETSVRELSSDDATDTDDEQE